MQKLHIDYSLVNWYEYTILKNPYIFLLSSRLFILEFYFYK